MVKQTAGRDALNDFAPKFAELNNDILFGKVWSREDKLWQRRKYIEKEKEKTNHQEVIIEWNAQNVKVKNIRRVEQ